MKIFSLLITMIFFHILDDFCLQGILADMKQKAWWRKQANNPMYQHDYIVALLAHAFSWTFMIHLPAWKYSLYYNTGLSCEWVYAVVFVAMLLIHAFVDDLKANKHKINLIQDQSIHMIQIVIVAILYSLSQEGV